MNKELRNIRTEMRVAKGDDGTRTVSGLIPYNSLSVELWGFRELIAPGAFADALGANADVLTLRDHDSTLLLGRTKSGTLSLSDSAEGLRYSLKLPNTTAGNDLAESIDRGDLDSTSFGFRTIDDAWAVDDEGSVIRTLKQVELFEVSPCSFAAYPDSSVDVRSIPAEFRSQVEQRRTGAKPEMPMPEPEIPVIDADLENLKLRVAIRSRRK